MTRTARALTHRPEFSHVSVIVPARNEARTIELVVEDIRRALPGGQILVVDNGSTDETAALAASAGASSVFYEPLPGKARAVLKALSSVRTPWVALIDADGEYSAADLPALLESAQNAKGMAIGERQVPIGTVHLSSVLANRLVQSLLQRSYGQDVGDVFSGSRVLETHLLRELLVQSEGFEMEAEITVGALRRGVELRVCPVSFDPRSIAQGKKIRARDLWPILRTIYVA